MAETYLIYFLVGNEITKKREMNADLLNRMGQSKHQLCQNHPTSQFMDGKVGKLAEGLGVIF